MITPEELTRARQHGEIDIVERVIGLFRERNHPMPDYWVDPLCHSIRTNVRLLNWRLQMKAIAEFFTNKIAMHGMRHGEDTRTVRAYCNFTMDPAEIEQVLSDWDRSMIMYAVDRQVNVY